MAFNFTLNDLDNIKIGLKKKKISSAFKERQDDLKYDYYIKNIWSKDTPIIVGDLLYDNFELDDYGHLLSLGTEDGSPIGICIIPVILPDSEVRFMSTSISNDIMYWGCTRSKGINNFVETLLVYDDPQKTIYFLKNNATLRPYFNTGKTYKINEHILTDVNDNGTLQPYTDFNGYENTNKIAQYFHNYDTMANECLLYNPKNSNTKGQWYLPALGELAMATYYYDFNKYIKPFQMLGSSTQSSKLYNGNTEAFAINTYNGEVSLIQKDVEYYKMLPFIKFKLSINFKINK